MAWKRVAAALMTTLGVGSASADTAAIVVRTFNHHGVPAEDLREARLHASAVLNAAGINVTWLDCWYRDKAPADAPARCREAVGGDLVLRLQHAPAAIHDRFTSLGFSLVTPKAGLKASTTTEASTTTAPSHDLPFLATVYADLAEAVARRAGIAPRPVLGRAIAHEIGHLLLNANSHPKNGLMRADWSQSELRRNDSSNWQFLAEEAETMRAAIRRRKSADLKVGTTN